MGNEFEKECNAFIRGNARNLNPPNYLNPVIDRQFKHPHYVYQLIKRILTQWLSHSYLLNKKEFLKFSEMVFGLDQTAEGKMFYKLFKCKNS